MQSRLLAVVVVMASLVTLPGLAGDSTLLPEDTPVEGRDVTLRCRVQVSPSLEPRLSVRFQWTKNGLDVESAHTDTLTIHNASIRDEGVYTCSVRPDERIPEASINNATYTLILKVPPVVSITQKRGDATLTVPESGVLTLTCQVTNHPKPPVGDAGYTWTLQRLGSSVEEELAEKSQHLTLQPVHRGRSGRYSCSVATDGNFFSGYRASTSSVLVLVQYLDSNVTLLPMEELTVVAGDEVNLTCQADSVPTATLTWLHQGRVLRTVEGKEDVLSFPATGCQDSGELQCRADNAVLNMSRQAATRLAVQCAPSIPGGSTQTRVSFRVGENVTLAVQVLANPAPTYTWSGPGLGGGHRSASLTLVSLETRHLGHYSVTVSNRLGSLVHAFLLTVQEQEGQLELKVGGGVAASLLCLLGLLCLLCCRRRTRLHGTVRKGASRSGQGQDREAAGCSHEAGRGGAREEGLGADLGSGHNTGHFGDTTGHTTEDYCSIDSADVIWQPQFGPALPSSTQGHVHFAWSSLYTPEVSYDVPPPAVRVTSPGTCVSRDKKPIRTVDTMATDDVIRGSPSDESQDSDSYLACHVVSQGLLYSSLTPHSPDPQTQYLNPHSPDPQTQYLTPHIPDPQTQYLTPHSPDPQTQYLTPRSPDPQIQYLTPHTPDPQTQYLTPLPSDESSRRGCDPSDVRGYVIPELD